MKNIPHPLLRPILTALLIVVLGKCMAQTLILQPDAATGQDAVIGNCIPCGYDNANFGTHEDMVAAGWTNGGAESDARSLIRFDLSSIPPNATVTSATLSLYFNPTSSNGQHSGDNTALLQRITSSWDENTVTWNNQPTTTSADEVTMAPTVDPTEDRPNIDVTDLVQTMVSDPANNFGLLFRMLDEGMYRRMVFASSDHPDPTRWPRLEVHYVPDTLNCITFQSGGAELGEDAVLGNCIPCGYDTTNFGYHDDMLAAGWTNGGAESDARSLIRFGLGSIPSNAIVTSATLALYFNPTSSNGQHFGDNTALIQRVTSPWVWNAVTWNDQPTTTTIDQVVMPPTSSSTEDRPNIDVTALVQTMVSDPVNNYGFLFRMLDESTYRRMVFASSDHPDPALHPTLTVCYPLPTKVTDTPSSTAQLGVFPNPFTTSTWLDLSAFNGVPVMISIQDMHGRQIRTERATGGSLFELQRGSLASGVYLVEAQGGQGPMRHARIVME